MVYVDEIIRTSENLLDDFYLAPHSKLQSNLLHPYRTAEKTHLRAESSDDIWLVKSTPLKEIESVGMILPMEKNMFQTTNQDYIAINLYKSPLGSPVHLQNPAMSLVSLVRILAYPPATVPIDRRVSLLSPAPAAWTSKFRWLIIRFYMKKLPLGAPKS